MAPGSKRLGNLTALIAPLVNFVCDTAAILRLGNPRAVPKQDARSTYEANKKGWHAATLQSFLLCSLQRLYVLRLQALGTLHYVELDRLAFLQAAESTRLDG